MKFLCEAVNKISDVVVFKYSNNSPTTAALYEIDFKPASVDAFCHSFE